MKRQALLILTALLLASTDALRSAETSPSQTAPLASGSSAGGLADAFAKPPEAAKPWAYMWRTPAETFADYTRHIEDLKAKGFGGFLYYAGSPSGFAKEPRFAHVLKETERCGMELGANITAAWPAGGGWVSSDHLPWATVSSTLDVQGGSVFKGKLPKPVLPEGLEAVLKNRAKSPGKLANDVVVTVAVLAYPLPGRPDPAVPKVTASTNPDGIRALLDGSWNTSWQPTAPPDVQNAPGEPEKRWPEGWNWLLVDYGSPHDVEAIWWDAGTSANLESSDDNVNFKRVLQLPNAGYSEFPTQRARWFRVVLTGTHTKPEKWAVRELAIGTKAEVKRRMQMASTRAFTMFMQPKPRSLQRDELALALNPLAPLPADQPLAAKGMIDLTSKVSADGALDWDVPPGRWRIVWLCRSVATAQEVIMGLPDYMNPDATREDFEKGFGPMGAAAGDKAGKVFRYYHEDNVEIHSMPNWTPSMLEEFQKRRGYDPRPYLATMAGEIVDSIEKTDRFLNDVRRTIADCVRDHRYQLWTDLSHTQGVQTRSEAGGQYQPRVLSHDGMENLARVDEMVGEFWVSDTWKEYWRTGNMTDTERMECAQNYNVKQVASASHLYGKPIVDMEAFTSFNYWGTAPRDLMLPANVAFCEGVNHLCFHGSDTTSASEGSPGSCYVGTHFNDKNTWWPQIGPFVQYIQRCSAMLQRGRFVGDVLYYIGDEVPAMVVSKHTRESLGFGYDYDECNAEALLTRLSVKDGRLVTTDGVSYRVLVLPERPVLTVAAAAKIKELVAAGATVIGPKPLRTPGLAGYPQCDAQLKAIADELWGKGKIVANQQEKAVLGRMGVPADFAFTGGQPDALLDFIHRQDGDADIYFVINRRNRTERVDCTFRVAGKQPELWNAVTGQRQDAPAYKIADGRTTVPLELPAYGSTFVVFKTATAVLKKVTVSNGAKLAKNGAGVPPAFSGKDGSRDGRPTSKGSTDSEPFDSAAFPELKPVMEVAGPWQVRFDPKWGGPKEPVHFDKLTDWPANSDEGIKYYSGTATYRTSFDVKSASPQAKLFLDLGVVNQLAVVRLNGKNLGVVWCAPWRVEITDAVKPGANELEIDVINAWFNRLVLDLSRPVAQRVIDVGAKGAYWGIPPVGKGQLKPAGLLGPVTIQE